MDFQRALLLGVIAIFSVMLLFEWKEFRQQRPDSPPQVTETAPYAETSPDLPGIPAAAEPAGTEDLPVIAEALAAEPQPAAVDTASHISVTSDVLKLRIDLQGGDIVYAALPRFNAKIDNPGVPLVLLQENNQRVYVAQSGLIGQNGIDKSARAAFTSARSSYALADDEDSLVVDLHYQSDGPVDVVKRYTLRRGEYVLNVEYLVSNNSGERWQANLFGQIKRDASPDPSSEDAAGMGMAPFLGLALTQPEERFSKFDFNDIAEQPFKQKLPGGWIALIQHYFISAWIPAPNQSHNYSTRMTPTGYYIGGFTSPALVVDPGKTGSVAARFYAGPKDQYSLKEISEYLDLTVDYGWLWWIAQPLFWLLIHIYDIVGNWGTAIILLTVLIKAAFFQLSATSYKSMANMRRVQPQMANIKERYAEDKQKQSQAMMELYKKEKINPLGGCLPILVQMPVFISLYWVLMESVELRQAPFYLWIHDLSVMDPYFVLPLIMGASMWFQQKLNPPPPDPMQAKVMQWMPIVFTVFFLWFPAGLVLYWVANNLLSITQQWIITRRIEQAAASKS